jgi:hypothetical protein
VKGIKFPLLDMGGMEDDDGLSASRFFLRQWKIAAVTTTRITTAAMTLPIIAPVLLLDAGWSAGGALPVGATDAVAAALELNNKCVRRPEVV